MANNRLNPVAFEIARRFQPTGDFDTNAGLACDPSGFAEIDESVAESIDYPRPAFNWPAPASAMSNFFALEGMSVSCLRKAGFEREARSLHTKLRNDPPAYNDLAEVIYRYLDFKPVEPLPAEQREKLQALAREMGIDALEIGTPTKTVVKNSLAHANMTPKKEWEWLVANAKKHNAFGKTAACMLSVPTIMELIKLWAPVVASPLALPASDSSYANLAWFRANFPLGWSHIDHLSESAVVSAPNAGDFGAMLSMAHFEMTDKIARGWPEKDARLFAFDHKNMVGVNGAAVLGVAALDYFQEYVIPTFAKRGSPRHTSSPAVELLLSTNPSLASSDIPSLTWTIYQQIAPESAAVINECFTKPGQLEKLAGTLHVNPKDFSASLRAFNEKLALIAAVYVPWPSRDGLESLPPLAPSKPTLRI